ncbi:ABC transporter substrate-binding protein [Pusillimonas sp. SM2304]|uniref:ABC transporter substrate-binding protein n=1 Tax=Pusillimonas sp. SM2304 TaxID=3073241 RepID=UPI002874B7CF|nr:ABC transporter substrate-binding protein [Pusillimonas sp. SM2304]MDS1138857.1 ABC transporter substrate-binding protein [Pusillimonas sp. SM2304]
MNLFRLLLIGLLSGLCSLASAAPIQVTDILGRQVTLPAPASRVVLAQARHFPVLALVHPDPANILAGWSDEFRTSFTNDYNAYLKAYPKLASVQVVARHTPSTFSIEQALALRPDLVVLTATFAGIGLGQSAEDSPLIQRLDAAGIPVIVIDFFVDPMQNTVPSLLALGDAVGQPERTREFVDFYRRHMDAIARRVADVPADQRPNVFVHAHAGSTDCCNSPGTGTFNDMITYAGGHNIGADVLKSGTGRLNFEYINSRNPMVYVATGTGSGKRTSSGLHIGMGTSPEEARKSLRAIIEHNRLQALPAVRNGNSHGIWHAFNDSPLHMIFIEALARWLQPERFADIDPLATLKEVNERFLTVPMSGTYLVDLEPTP